MAVIEVDMKFCDRKTKVTVKARDDGEFDLHIATNCDSVKRYADRLGDRLSMVDITERSLSKIFSPVTCEPITLTCLTPAAIMTAAWLESGMMSKSRANKIDSNCLNFISAD